MERGIHRNEILRGKKVYIALHELKLLDASSRRLNSLLLIELAPPPSLVFNDELIFNDELNHSV